MTRIVCGWCGEPAEGETCPSCGHDPVAAWFQRGLTPPASPKGEGRPALSASEIRDRYHEAVAKLDEQARASTVEAIAELLDRSPRTVRDWRRRYDLA